MILEDLIFEPFGIYCPECHSMMSVAFEDLRLNKEVSCPKHDYKFFPDTDVDALLGIVKLVEGAQQKTMGL